MKTILVTGSNGQLGRELQQISQNQKELNFIFTDKSNVDISSIDQIREFLSNLDRKQQINSIINCAAYTAVDKAESEPETAHKVNVNGAYNLAKITQELGAKLVHVSTDFVFDGTKSSPYLETDSKCPVSVYGRTKSEGENKVLEENPNSLVLRTSWVYSKYGKNFFNTIRKLASEREILSVVNDQIGTPTWAKDLASVCLEAAESNHSGIFHFSNEGVASWYDFAYEIVDSFGYPCKVVPIPSENYPTPAKRPSYSVLNKSRFNQTFLFQNQNWQKQVRALVKQIQTNN